MQEGEIILDLALPLSPVSHDEHSKHLEHSEHSEVREHSEHLEHRDQGDEHGQINLELLRTPTPPERDEEDPLVLGLLSTPELDMRPLNDTDNADDVKPSDGNNSDDERAGLLGGPTREGIPFILSAVEFYWFTCFPSTLAKSQHFLFDSTRH